MQSTKPWLIDYRTFAVSLSSVFCFTLLITPFQAIASQAIANEMTSEITSIPEIGNHHRVFILEKNENPQNQIVVFTKVDQQCRFQRESASNSRPVLDFYWLLNRKQYKKISNFAKYGVRKKVALGKSGMNSFFVKSDFITRFHRDLHDAQIEIRSEKVNDQCEVYALAHLVGSSAPIRLERVYSELKKTFLPPFRKVVSMTLNGETVSSGEKVRKTYRGG